MAINEIICLPARVSFYSEFVKILIGRIPGVIIMYVASILEKWLRLCHAYTMTNITVLQQKKCHRQIEAASALFLFSIYIFCGIKRVVL